MKKLSTLLTSVVLILLLQGCAVYTPYAPVGYYSSPAYRPYYRPYNYGPPRYNGWYGRRHPGWRGPGYGWRGHPGWRGGYRRY